MRYLPRHFVDATAELLNESSTATQRAVLTNLPTVLAKKKLTRHLPKILTAIEKKLIHQQGGRIIEITLAKKTKANENKITETCQKADLVKITENPNLIAGAKIIINREYVLDCSLAGRLQKIFS